MDQKRQLPTGLDSGPSPKRPTMAPPPPLPPTQPQTPEAIIERLKQENLAMNRRLQLAARQQQSLLRANGGEPGKLLQFFEQSRDMSQKLQSITADSTMYVENIMKENPTPMELQQRKEHSGHSVDIQYDEMRRNVQNLLWGIESLDQRSHFYLGRLHWMTQEYQKEKNAHLETKAENARLRLELAQYEKLFNSGNADFLANLSHDERLLLREALMTKISSFHEFINVELASQIMIFATKSAHRQKSDVLKTLSMSPLWAEYQREHEELNAKYEKRLQEDIGKVRQYLAIAGTNVQNLS